MRNLLRIFRTRHWHIGLGAVLFALTIAVVGLGYWYFAAPTWFTVAVNAADSPEARVIDAFAKALERTRRDIRLNVVVFDDVRQSAQALRQHKADLAVVRPDVFLPDNGLTVAILREEALLIAAPKASKIEDMAALEKKRLGVITHHEADLPVLTTVLAHYDLAPPNLTLVQLSPNDVAAAFTSNRIDALAFVAAPVGRQAGELVRTVLKVSNDAVSLVPVKQVDALALKFPALTKMTVSDGSLSGRPELPDEELSTVTVSYRLMARIGLDRNPISKVTQYLFQMRSRVASTAPSINLMKAPENDTMTSAALPNHPGAVDYFNREQESFMDRYGDWVWLLLFAGGGVSSVLAWLSEVFARKRRQLVDELLDRLTSLISEVREVKTPGELDAVTQETDHLVTHAIRYARQQGANARAMNALILAVDAVRTAIADRRRELTGHRGAAPPRLVHLIPERE